MTFRQLARFLKQGDGKACINYLTLASRLPQLWVNPCKSLRVNKVPVHVLCGRDQWTMALWMMVSFTQTTKINWKFIIHDDGSFNPKDIEKAWQVGLETELIPRKSSDETCLGRLSPFTNCMKHRQISPHALKLYDPFLLGNSQRYIVLDTDLLFFAKPEEIVEWVEGVRSGPACMEDLKESSQVSSEIALHLFGINLVPRVNSGICLVHRDLIDIRVADSFIDRAQLLEKNLWMVEQTLYALFLSGAGNGWILPRSYELSSVPVANPGCIMRHYVGCIRNRFYSEGIPRVANSFLRE